MTGYTPRPAAALDPSTPLPERLELLAAWWDAEASRLAAPRPGDSAAVRSLRGQRAHGYAMCAADLRAVLAPAAAPLPASAPLAMAADRADGRPAACAGCAWTYHGDGGPWRLTRLDPSCPVHGPALAGRPAPPEVTP